MAATMLSMQTSRLAAGAAARAAAKPAASGVVSAPRAAGVVARASKQQLWYPGTCPQWSYRPGGSDVEADAHKDRARGRCDDRTSMIARSTLNQIVFVAAM